MLGVLSATLHVVLVLDLPRGSGGRLIATKMAWAPHGVV